MASIDAALLSTAGILICAVIVADLPLATGVSLIVGVGMAAFVVPQFGEGWLRDL
jgi:hypothetical protein